MARHRIPDTARLQMGQSHLKLAGSNLSRQNVFVDGAMIRFFQCSKLHLVFRFNDDHTVRRCSLPFDKYRRIGGMRRRAVQIKFRRFFGIGTCKGNLFFPFSDIHAVTRFNFINGSIHRNGSFSADVNETQFPPLQKICCAEFFSCG